MEKTNIHKFGWLLIPITIIIIYFNYKEEDKIIDNKIINKELDKLNDSINYLNSKIDKQKNNIHYGDTIYINKKYMVKINNITNCDIDSVISLLSTKLSTEEGNK